MKYLLLSFLFIATIGNAQVTTTINFDDDTKWIAGSSGLTSYQPDHQYNDGIFSSTAVSGLRNTTAVTDGVAGANGVYSWRVQNATGAYFEANIASGGVSTFNLMVRRWDGVPEAVYSLEYSTDGSTWVPVMTVNDTQWGGASNFIQVGGTINSANANIKIRLTNVSGERVIIDDFQWTSFVASCDTYATISATACETYTSPSGNYIWTSSNTYNDTIPNAALCDSIITVNLTINQPQTVSASASICTGQTYTFGSQTLTDADAGLHTETFSDVNTCDSTVNLTLTVVSSYSETATATICEGETYVFGTQNLTSEAGNPYVETFTSTGNCDSIVTLTLTVIPRTYETINVTACDSYESPSGNYTWTTSNTYNDTILNAMNCDSVITINLTINNATSSTLNESVCGTYDFFGSTLTTSGVYVHTIQNAAMCDSVITLNLDVTPMPIAPITSGDTSYCENDILEDMTAVSGNEFGELIIAGIADGPLPGGLPKVVEFYAIQDIADMSIFGFGSASNGGGSDGEEFTFPAISLNAGEYYYVSTDSVNFNAFYGFYPNTTEGTASNNNGDDAIELFKNGVVIDVFGEIDVDGSGTAWEYLDGWAYRNTNALPNGGIFNISEWTFSGINNLEGGTTNATCAIPYTIGTMTVTLPTSTFTWYSDATLTTQIGTGNTQTPAATNGATAYYVTETYTGATICESAAAMVTITINANPTGVTFGTLSNLCENAGNYTLVEGAPAGGTYSGTGVSGGSFDPSTAGVGQTTLTYTVTDGNNCSAEATQTITVDAAPTVTLSSFTDMCVYNPSVTLTGGLPAGGVYSGTGVSGGSFDPATAGNGTHTITYTYTDGNNCEGTATNTITVDGCATVNETSSLQLNVFPNPTKGEITIQFEGSSAAVQIVDLTGKSVLNSQIVSNESIDLSSLNAGTYFIHLTMNGSSVTERIVVQ